MRVLHRSRSGSRRLSQRAVTIGIASGLVVSSGVALASLVALKVAPFGAADGAASVPKVQPSLSASPSPASATLGSPVSDVATMSGGTTTVGGSIGYTLYSNSDSNCATPLSTASAAVAGNGSYSGSATPSSAGTYKWSASYTGDALNSPAPDPSTCGNGGTVIVSATFGATDLGSATCTVTSSSSHACTTTATFTTNGKPILIFVNAVGTGSSTTSVSSISGPFSSAAQLTNGSVHYLDSGSTHHAAFAWGATGSSTSGTVKVTLDTGTTQGSIAIEIVQLNAGDSVAKAVASSNGNTGSTNNCVVSLPSPSSTSDSEVAFFANGSGNTVTAPSGGGWALLPSPQPSGNAAFSKQAVQASDQTFTMSSNHVSCGTVAIEISP